MNGVVTHPALRSKVTAGESSKGRESEVTCCGDTGSVYVSTTSSSSSKSYANYNGTTQLLNASSSTASSNQSYATAAPPVNIQVNYNNVAACPGESSKRPSNFLTNGEDEHFANEDANGFFITGGAGSSSNNILSNNAQNPNYFDGAASSNFNGNIILECNSGTTPDSVRSLSPPDSKRQRTMLEKTCAIWEGFEPLKQSRQLTVSEWRQQSRFWTHGDYLDDSSNV